MIGAGTKVKPATLSHYASERNVRWMNDPEVVRHLRHRPRVDLQSAGDYFLKNQHENVLLAIDHDGEHVGNCGLFSVTDSSAELRLCIGEKSAWGKGIGGESMRQMIEIARTKGLRKVWLQVGQANERARLLYERLGFKKVGEDMAGDAPQDRMELEL